MAWERIVYRDIWADDLRLIVNGTDRTYFRDTLAQVGGYQLQEPFGYGPADFAFPQITELEVADFGVAGTGLGWLHHGGSWELRPANGGTYGKPVWKGFVSTIRVSDGAVQVHCDGDASGRLVLRDAHPAIFARTKDIGLWCYDLFRLTGLTLKPRLGPTTGVEADNRGFGGGTYLDRVNELLSLTTTVDGNQWTVMPNEYGNTYSMALKDLSTVDATVFVGTEGVKLDLADDLQERPTTIYGSGTRPDGQKWVNAKAPNLIQGDTPPYPFTDGRTFGEGTSNADTDTGDGITVMNNKLIGVGALDREDIASTWDADITDAVEDVQEDAGLPVTGTMDPTTWDALFDVSTNGLSILQASVFPLAQQSRVRKWNYTSSGAIAGSNPGFDADAIEVDRSIDHGPGVKKSRARKWSKRTLNRLHSGKNWVGTVELKADVFAGNAHHTDATLTPMSRLDLRPGMNLMLRHFDSGVLVHISGVNVDADRTVRLAVDSQARDLLTVGQIIARNKESRRNPAREWLQSYRSGSSPSFNNQVIWSELGGKLPVDVALTGNTWNVFKVAAGQEGTVQRMHLQTVDQPAAFCYAVFGREVGPGMLNANVGNPFTEDADGNTVWADTTKQQWFEDHVLLDAYGSESQPCGYWPKQHTNDKGEVTSHPITGEFWNRAGFGFRTLDEAVLYVAIYPDRDCIVQAGRIMWPLQSEGA